MAFEPFNLGNVLAQAEQINQFRANRDPNSTKNQLAQQQLTNAQQTGANALNVEQRAATAANQATSQHNTDQQLANTKRLFRDFTTVSQSQDIGQIQTIVDGLKADGLVQPSFSIEGRDINELRQQAGERAQAIGAGLQSLSQKDGGFTLSQGQTRFSKSGDQVASVAPKPDKPAAPTSEEKNFNLAQKNPLFAKFLKKNKDNTGLNFTQESGLRKEFSKASGDFIKVRDAHTRILKSAENPSPAGDLALVFNFMKVLDPGSTVREGEFQTAASAKAAIGEAEERGDNVPNFVKTAINRLTKGTILLPAQRKDFLSRSDALFNGQLSNQTELENIFTGISERNGLNPANTVLQFRLPQNNADEGFTDEDYDALRQKVMQ